MRAPLTLWLKWWLFPGLNLHARCRNARMPRHFLANQTGAERALVLDAGSGNGMLTYQAWKRGARAVGVTFKTSEVEGSRQLFNRHLGIPESQLRFMEGNLYALDFADATFDEIICSETLEHLRQDEAVARRFWALLKPGGVLHVCTPNAEHPYNRDFPLDPDERGGHVRRGYTLASYRALFEPIGFVLDTSEGLGGPLRQWFNARIKRVQERWGALAGLPLFALAVPLLPFDSARRERAQPFSIYVRLRKPR